MCKVAYFDENVGAPWAAAEYEPDEIDKLGRLFQHKGSLRSLKFLKQAFGTGRLTYKPFSAIHSYSSPEKTYDWKISFLPLVR